MNIEIKWDKEMRMVVVGFGKLLEFGFYVISRFGGRKWYDESSCRKISLVVVCR